MSSQVLDIENRLIKIDADPVYMGLTLPCEEEDIHETIP
jgi:hypothetical protein